MLLKKTRVCRLVMALLFCSVGLIHAQDTDWTPETVDTSDNLVAKGISPTLITDAIVRERLAQLNGCLQLRSNAVVRGYIKTYVVLKSDKTKRMLSKRLTYFPVFERKLKEHGLPADLKYLSVVESALNPKAVSRVGATGLWQFMPATGSDYGLRQNSVVDERIDPVEATDAAMRYLKDLYKQYNDWALALAAYNSGPGRVNAAIKKAHSRNFWTIQRYLPSETQNYVPAFIAASYICNFFQQHELEVDNPDLDEQLTDFVRVYESLSFRDISDATGINYATVKLLNPGYKRDYVPANPNGQYVILPKRVMPAFLRYLNSLGGRRYGLDNSSEYNAGPINGGDGRYAMLTLQVQKPESIESFAQRSGLCGEHLKAWNNLSGNYLYAGQSLTIWRPVFIQKHQNMRIEAPVAESRNRKSENVSLTGGRKGNVPAAPAVHTPAAIAPATNTGAAPPAFQWHTVRRNESLDDIARMYNISVEQLRKLNNLTSVKFGMRLKIKQL